MVEVKIFEEEKEWQNFLDENNYLSFLQDWEYGEIEKNLGRLVLRLGFFHKNKLVGLAQIIGYKRKLANGLVIHHGPVIKEEFLETGIQALINFLKEKGYSKKYDFLRINSCLANEEKYLKIFKKMKFKLAPTYAVSENFFIKELKGDEEMLKEMKKNHRQLVLDSLKKPFLEIEKTKELDKLEIFWQLYQDLYRRKNFVPYPKNFIFEEFKIFAQKNKALLFLGKVENKYYSAALIIFSHQIAFYHHSASLPIKEPLNYKIQWEVMQEAKKMGCRYYNFWGLAKKMEPSHPWYGLSLFKIGFGGRRIDFLPALDFVFKPKYYLLYFYEKIKRKNL